MNRIVLLISIIGSICLAQHNIPFASVNNAVELSVVNGGLLPMSNTEVTIENVPTWLTFSEKHQTITNIQSKQGKPVVFTFSADKSAPINTPFTLKFIIVNSTGERWRKEITVQISPPEKIELFQNYPNPFNPSTVIGYQLTTPSDVSLKVYDIIGKEVASLDEGTKEAGYHQTEWNGSNVASGMYIYQLAIKNERGRYDFFRKKMLLMK